MRIDDAQSSAERSRADADAPAGAGVRCSLTHAREARKYYGRHAREPAHPDERGALVVVELLDCGNPGHACGGRLAFFRIAGVDQCEIRRLPRAA